MGSKKKGQTKGARPPSQTQVEEKRLEHRHTLVLETEVHFHEQFVKGMFRCRTSNIGIDGVFLPSDKMPITRITNIELVFRDSTKLRPKKYRIAAKVVRNSAEGAALVFCPKDEKQVQEFRRFLLKAKVANRQ